MRHARLLSREKSPDISARPLIPDRRCRLTDCAQCFEFFVATVEPNHAVTIALQHGDMRCHGRVLATGLAVSIVDHGDSRGCRHQAPSTAGCFTTVARDQRRRSCSAGRSMSRFEISAAATTQIRFTGNTRKAPHDGSRVTRKSCCHK